MQAREADYLRFARDLRVQFTNNAAEQATGMSKLRIKISGCMRSMTGAEEFCAIRSYLATPPATASAPSTPSPAPTRAPRGSPRPDKPARHHSADPPPSSNQGTPI
jgi:Transposase IS66 family